MRKTRPLIAVAGWALLVLAACGSSSGGDGSSTNTIASDAGGLDGGTILPFGQYSEGACPALHAGPTADAGLNTGFRSGGQERQFRLLVPASYDGQSDWPVVTAWHWLASNSAALIADGDLERAVEELHFIAIVPDSLKLPNGSRAYPFDWPFFETTPVDKAAAEIERRFMEDMLACTSQQYRLDPRRVYAAGVSAGALWVTALGSSPEAERIAALASISGGLAQGAGWTLEYKPQPNKFPALVVWGGPTDWFIVDFDAASRKYRDALVADGHVVVACEHDKGHAIPPFVPPPGSTRLYAIWRFLLDHSQGAPSPYAAGLPSFFPSWCAIASP